MMNLMILLILLFLGLDILSKIAIVKYFEVNQSITLIDNFLSLTYAKNTGIAWSLFDNKMYLILGVSLVIIIFVIWYIFKNKPNHMLEKLAYAMVLSGAIGNFLNRLFYSYVIDFIDIKVFGYNYPVFNLADIFIVIGVIILIIFDWWCGSARNKGRR